MDAQRDAGVADALRLLDQLLDAPRRPGVALGNWRWLVRQRVVTLRDALGVTSTGAGHRERAALMVRLGGLGDAILEAEDVERVRVEVKRVVIDIDRHLHQSRATT